MNANIYILLASQRICMFFITCRNYKTMLQIKQHSLITFWILLDTSFYFQTDTNVYLFIQHVHSFLWSSAQFR